MLQYKVPQNIKMADQIIGPLTLEQFLYILFGAGGIYLVYTYTGYNNLFIGLAIIIAFLAFAFAFIPIYEQPFSKFVLNIILFLARPKVLTWQQMPPPIFETPTIKKDTQKEKEEIQHPEEVISQLQQLSLILDTQPLGQTTRQTLQEMATDKPKPITAEKKTKITPPAATQPINPPTVSPVSSVSNFFSKLFKRQEAKTPQQQIKETNDAKKEAIANIINTNRQ